MSLSCAFCKAPLEHTFVDLGKTPLANRYLTKEMLAQHEPSYPLHARVCAKCLLVQVEPAVPAEEIFGDYAYFSSFSSSWLEHAKRFTQGAIQRFKLDSKSRVIEVASNDGYLLKNFVAAGIPCLGVEPARNIAELANKAGIPTEAVFFGKETAKRLLTRDGAADLMVGNNVLAHVPDINDFVSGFATLLAPKGVISIEVPHILKLIEQTAFDTIYHEHYSYYSFFTLEKIFAAHGMQVFDVEELTTHGGSLRIWACHNQAHPVTPAIEKMRQQEAAAGINKLDGYRGFEVKVKQICQGFSDFIKQHRGKQIAAYGAAAKGNTLLNVCGIKADQIAYVCDLNPAKQGHYLPGSHIPIFSPDKIKETKPDFLVILPWNIAPEVTQQMKEITAWGGQFVTAIPSLQTKKAA
jgi:SAM-dependent methyltransferase